MTYTQEEIEFLTSDEFQKAIKPYWTPTIRDFIQSKELGVRLVTHTLNKEQITIIDFEKPFDKVINPKNVNWLIDLSDLKEIAGKILNYEHWYDTECCFFDYCDNPDNLKETELLTLAEYALKLLKRKQ